MIKPTVESTSTYLTVFNVLLACLHHLSESIIEYTIVYLYQLLYMVQRIIKVILTPAPPISTHPQGIRMDEVTNMGRLQAMYIIHK